MPVVFDDTMDFVFCFFLLFCEECMIIQCPECAFAKDVPPNELPKPVVIATCPQCGARFRFSVEEGCLGLEDNLLNRTPKDDPLPKGAIICSDTEEKEEDKYKASEELSNAPFERKNLSEDKPKQGRETVSAKRLFGKGAGNPWDHAPGRIGWFASFYQTCLRVMFQAPRFFRSLSPDRQFHLPLFFYLIVCLFELLVNYGWLHVFRQTLIEAGDPDLTALFALLAPDGNIIFMVLLQTAFSTLKLYITSGLFFLVFQFIAPDRNNYALIFQVVAYSIAPVVLSLVPLAGSLCGALWSVACLAIGLRQVLGVSWLQTLLAFLPVLCLLLFSMRFLAAL
ncbi:MAG: zinc-ribbon domain-containing protein [Desulfovibrio sp.]|nr:zinc-ribbon domain-containing protein [Desulfovibrio sp.]